jgi:hypothetical protein
MPRSLFHRERLAMQTHDRPRLATRARSATQVAETGYSSQPERSPRLSVVACSLCLRVLRDSTWIEAEQAIRELRSYELPEPVLLEPGLCDQCSDVIQARRDTSRRSR